MDLPAVMDRFSAIVETNTDEFKMVLLALLSISITDPVWSKYPA